MRDSGAEHENHRIMTDPEHPRLHPASRHLNGVRGQSRSSGLGTAAVRPLNGDLADELHQAGFLRARPGTLFGAMVSWAPFAHANCKPGRTHTAIVLEVAMRLLRCRRVGNGLPKLLGVFVAATAMTLVLGASAALATTPTSTTGKGAYSSRGVNVNIQVSAYQYPDGSL